MYKRTRNDRICLIQNWKKLNVRKRLHSWSIHEHEVHVLFIYDPGSVHEQFMNKVIRSWTVHEFMNGSWVEEYDFWKSSWTVHELNMNFSVPFMKHSWIIHERKNIHELFMNLWKKLELMNCSWTVHGVHEEFMYNSIWYKKLYETLQQNYVDQWTMKFVFF